MTKEFNNLEEIQKYYNKETNTYIFIEDNEYIDLVIFNFNLEINSGINARNINAYNIKAYNIKAWDIKAVNINACNINAWDIMARNINALDINAGDIDAVDINAGNIDVYDIKANNICYYAVCYAYNNIKCKSIKGKRETHKHFVLDGVLEFIDDRKTNE